MADQSARVSRVQRRRQEISAAYRRFRRNPVGPEMLRGRGWYVYGHSIQVIETTFRRARHRWMVVVFWPNRKYDRRYPVRFFRNDFRGLELAFAYARHLKPGCPIAEIDEGEDWSCGTKSEGWVRIMRVSR